MVFGKAPPVKQTIRDTIAWGQTYRYERDKLPKPSILPVSSPLNMQLLCEQLQRSKQLADIRELKRKLKINPQIQLTLKERVDPDAVSKKEYYDYMSTPRQIHKPRPKPPPPKIPKWLLKKPKEPCSPHIDKLALPTKVHVLHTWKDYAHSLPMEIVTRLEDLLHDTEQNVNPRFASCYFKTLDQRRRKNKHRKIVSERKRKQKKKLKNEHKEWLTSEINLTVEQIVSFLENESLFAVNFKQMMISEAILNKLHEQGDLEKRPSRNTNKPFGRCLVDIVDQISVWIDAIVRYVDVQYTESVLKLGTESDEDLLGGCEGEMEEEEEEVVKQEEYQAALTYRVLEENVEIE